MAKNPGIVTRQLVSRLDGHQCVYCGSRGNITVDHVVPKSRGGTNRFMNLVTACAWCNNTRGTISFHAMNPSFGRFALTGSFRTDRALKMKTVHKPFKLSSIAKITNGAVAEMKRNLTRGKLLVQAQPAPSPLAQEHAPRGVHG